MLYLKNIKIIASILIIVTMFIISNFTYSKNKIDENLKCYIEVEKKQYKLGEPIVVKLSIYNESSDVIDLKISDKIYHNFNFLVKTLKNRVVAEKDEFFLLKETEYTSASKENDKLNIKTVKLHPKEYYGKSFNLLNYYKLEKEGNYVVTAYFYPIPNVLHNHKYIESQMIQIDIQGSLQEGKLKEKRFYEIKKELENIKTPDGTLDYVLKSASEKNYEKYFVFIDFESLIDVFPVYKNRYQKVKPSKRRFIIEIFKDYIKNNFLKDMKEYNIVKTIIIKDKAYINVNIENKNGSKSRYIFSFYKKNDVWYLFNYIVVNINQ